MLLWEGDKFLLHHRFYRLVQGIATPGEYGLYSYSVSPPRGDGKKIPSLAFYSLREVWKR